MRATRERLAARRNYDVRALAEEAKDRERASNRKVVKLTPRRPAAAAAAAATEGNRAGTLDPRTLDEIVRRVVEVAQPERIVLFGSAARGDMTRHSDVDLLIVKDGADALEKKLAYPFFTREWELLTADGWRALREVGDCAATTVCCTFAGVRPRPLRVRESTGLRRGISIVQRANERDSTNAGP